MEYCMGLTLITGGNLLNKGAQSMVLITVSELKKRFPGERIIVVSDPDATGDPKRLEPYDFEFRDASCIFGGGYKLIQRRYGKLGRHKDEASLLKKADRVIDISGYTFGTNWGYLANLLAAYRAKRARKYHVPIYYMPQSFGPFSFHGILGKFTKHCMQKWLSYAKVLYVREVDGMQEIEKNFHFSNAALSTDLVLQNKGIDLSVVFTKEFIASRERAVDAPKPGSVAILPNDRNLKFGDADQVLKVYRRLVLELLSLGREIYLIHHAAEDLRSCRMIKDLFAEDERVHLIEREFSCIEYGEYVKHFDYLIASRYHGVVHAFKEGIPCIVLGWAVKYTELLGTFDQLSYAMDVRKNPDPEVAAKVLLQMNQRFREESEHIRVKLAGVQKKNAFDILGVFVNTDEHVQNISKVASDGLCCSCGICAGVCPVGAISFERSGGGFVPKIDERLCIQCGKCLRCCPGEAWQHGQNCTGTGEEIRQHGRSYTGTKEERGQNGRSFVDVKDESGQRTMEAMGVQKKSAPKCLSVQTKRPLLVKSSTSGGFITGMVSRLLEEHEYDGAFLVKGYSYDVQKQSELVTELSQMEETEKSRYIPVSQEKAIRYILSNADKKIIYVGTPCAVHGLLKALKDSARSRDNILIIGLFCDMSMNYSMYDYAKHLYGKEKEIAALHFRDKRAGGYPGNMRIEYVDGSYRHVSAKERMILKDFCRLERCLYCLDKLNEHADFSVGDNYTGKDSYVGGSCSVIIRTPGAERLWEEKKDDFAYAEAEYKDILHSQKLALRMVQLANLDEYAGEHVGRKPETGIPGDLSYLLELERGQKHDKGSCNGSNLMHQRADISLGASGDYSRIDKAKKSKKRKLYVDGLKARLKL